jgi:hypothetical protein
MSLAGIREYRVESLSEVDRTFSVQVGASRGGRRFNFRGLGRIYSLWAFKRLNDSKSKANQEVLGEFHVCKGVVRVEESDLSQRGGVR